MKICHTRNNIPNLKQVFAEGRICSGDMYICYIHMHIDVVAHILDIFKWMQGIKMSQSFIWLRCHT